MNICSILIEMVDPETMQDTKYWRLLGPLNILVDYFHIFMLICAPVEK